MQLLFTAESSKLPMANSLAVLVFLQVESFAFFAGVITRQLNFKLTKN